MLFLLLFFFVNSRLRLNHLKTLKILWSHLLVT